LYSKDRRDTGYSVKSTSSVSEDTILVFWIHAHVDADISAYNSCKSSYNSCILTFGYKSSLPFRIQLLQLEIQ